MEKQINTFNKGMIGTSPEFTPNESFIYGFNGRINYNGREMSFTNKDGTLQISTTALFQAIVEEIMGHYSFEDELILFTKKSGSDILGNCWSVKETGVNTYSFENIHEAEYNFTSGKKLICKGVFENQYYKRVYFTDGIEPFRKINTVSATLSTTTISELNVFAETFLPIPKINDISNGGSVKAMKVQYCYRLTNNDGSLTNFSLLSLPEVILENYSTITQETAGLAGDNTGKSIKIRIDGFDITRFKTIEVYALEYEAKDTITSVKTLGVSNLVSTQMDFFHSGNEATSLINADYILKNTTGFDTCEELEIFENLLLAANIKYKESNLYDFDVRIRSSNITNSVYSEDFNPNPKEYKYVPGFGSSHQLHGGASNGFFSGSGIRLSWTTEDEVISTASGQDTFFLENKGFEDFDKFGNKDFNESIRYSSNKASYQRGEIYRFAFKASKYGKNAFVKYIGDLQVPRIEDNISYIDDNGNAQNGSGKYVISDLNGSILTGKAIYLKVELKIPESIRDQFDQFEILRVKRTASDKTILDQGVVFPTHDVAPNPENSNPQYPEAFVFAPSTALGRALVIDMAGLYRKTDATYSGNPDTGIYSFDSPRIASQLQEYEINAETRFVIQASMLPIASITGRFNKRIDGDEFYYDNYRHVLYKHDYSSFSPIAKRVKNNSFIGQKSIMSGGIFGQSKNIANIGLGNFFGEDYNIIYRETIDLQRKRISPGEPTMLLNLKELNSEDSYLIPYYPEHTFNGSYTPFEFLNPLKQVGFQPGGQPEMEQQYVERTDRPLFQNGDKIVYNLLIANLEIDLISQYGGRNEQSIRNNQYMSCYKADITTESDYSFNVAHGDIYIDLFNHMKFSKKDTPDIALDFVSESVSSAYGVVLETDLPQIYAKGIKAIKDYPSNETGEVYVFNEAYISSPAKINVAEPLNFQEVLEYKNQIQVSNVKINGDTSDSWSVFNPENFHDLNLTNGAITNLIRLKNFIYATQSEKVLSKLYINSRAIVPTEDNRSISIDQQNTVNIEYSEEISIYGTNIIDSVAISDENFMFLDDTHKKIILFQEGQAVPISDITSNQNQLYEELKNETITDVTGYYDERYTEMGLTIFTASGKILTVCYNDGVQYKLFNGFSPVKSKQYISFRNKVFAENNLNELHILNEGPKGFAFNQTHDLEIEMIVNPSISDVKIFDNFIGVIKSNGIKFKELIFSTNIVDEQILLNDDNRYKIREGRHLIPLKKPGYQRMRGDYLKLKIKFDNSSGNEISIASVLTQFRKSFK